MEENSKEIAISNVEKFITVEEMNAVIAVLKSRQEYFKTIAGDREGFKGEAIEKIKSIGDVPEDIVSKLELLSDSLAKEMDIRFIKDHKEELDAQAGVNEFLFRFTGEPQTNYKNLFTSED